MLEEGKKKKKKKKEKKKKENGNKIKAGTADYEEDENTPTYNMYR